MRLSHKLEICIQYANGNERVLRSFKNRETATRWVDALYHVKGYPLHYAYVIRGRQLA